MRSLSLNEILIRNYRSFKVDWIRFPQTPGLKLLTGDNKIEPRLGANGAGKSSFWDAFVWALTGNSIKGAKISDVLAWGEIGMQVIIQIQIGKELHVIDRTGPPMRIKLDEQPATQEQIDQLIGLSRLRLLHSVVFGQGIPLFPDLPVPKRGELFDEVLDLEIWSKCSEAATDKHKLLEADLNKKKTTLASLEGQLKGLPTDESITLQSIRWITEWEKEKTTLEEQIENWEEERQTRIKELLASSETWISDHQIAIQDLEKEEGRWKEELLKLVEEKAAKIEELEADAAPLKFKLEHAIETPFAGQITILTQKQKSHQKRWQEALAVQRQAEYEIVRKDEEAEFWKKAICPSCQRVISDNEQITQLATIERIKIRHGLDRTCAVNTIAEEEKEIATVNKQIDELKEITTRENEKHKAAEEAVEKIIKQVASIEKEATSLLDQYNNKNPFTKQINQFRERPNPYIEQRDHLENKSNPFILSLAKHKQKNDPFINLLEKNKKERETLQAQIDTHSQETKQVESQLVAVEYWKHGFKRIRLFFVEQILLALQIEIGSALSALGLEGWKVTLATESENKSGSIKLGINIHIKSPKSEGSWDVWSGGETQRLRLAIAMGLASLIQRAAGVWYNLEVWDEPTNWLGTEGIEDLLAALQYRAESQNKQIWIVDHRALMFSGFKEIWGAIKDSDGTKVIKVMESED